VKNTAARPISPLDSDQATGRGNGGQAADPNEAGVDRSTVDRRRLLTWLWRLPVLLTLGAAGYGAWLAYRVHFHKDRPSRTPTFAARDPVAVAALADLPLPWDSRAFTIAGLPAIALKVPAPIPGGLSVGDQHFAAFSRICTHQGCIVNLNRDLEAIALAFNYRTDKPELVCHCHLSVFDPSRAGRAVSGPAVKPLPRIRLEYRSGMLLANGIEVDR